MYISSGFKDLPYSNVRWNIGEAEYNFCAGAALFNLDLVQLKSTLLIQKFI